ncbi:Transcriptional regulatory protein ZraR [Maioricimonas rarisocia]|uniref:Transcriptional regulatory protein ZraR n=1 Tax=Maioricimonas rarisocia TaxID=2528026 RepID=A0A517Z0Z2_9PLAN|nr:sigma-54 dependent transcriptional regulator [Maioricimonas rarisocia]QDU36152.1 Transcriptional regulatory protein ZraR [Maioricimonas rarisocia]
MTGTDHRPERILIADDEPLFLRTTGELLRREGYRCVCVSDAASAMEQLRQHSFDLVLSDLNMPGNFKLELLHDHSKHRSRIPLIVVTGVPTLPSAIESIRLGIADYLLKPVRVEDLLASVRRALDLRRKARPRRCASRDEPDRFGDLIGASRPMQELYAILERISGSDANVLIRGESGTGKEIVARTIHENSRRAEGPFQVIDCTAVPDSLFESVLFGHVKGAFTGASQDHDGLLARCDGGTAFLDELGELPLPMQGKLLRAVQEQTFLPVGGHTPRRINTRFICATHRDLEAEVEAGRFRQDLYYRLSVIPIQLPPLRERREDIMLLAEHLLRELAPPGAAGLAFSPQVKQRLEAYDWPGNVRELRNFVEYAVALNTTDSIDLEDLPASLREGTASSVVSCRAGDVVTDVLPEPLVGATRTEVLATAESRYLELLMTSHRGNVSEAARQAGLSRQGLHKLLKRYGIDPDAFRV